MPTELREKVTKEIKLEFSLVDTKPGLKKYPLINESDFNNW